MRAAILAAVLVLGSANVYLLHSIHHALVIIDETDVVDVDDNGDIELIEA